MGKLVVTSPRALDALVAEKVMGWRREGSGYSIRPGHRPSRDRPGEVITDFDDKGPHDYLLPPTEKWHTDRVAYCGCESTVELPPYSTDIAAAWEAVEQVTAGDFILQRYPETGWQCSFGRGVDFSRAATAQLAICLAALKAAGIEVEMNFPAAAS